MFMHKQPSTKINKAQVKLKSIQSKIFMYVDVIQLRKLFYCNN